jgi:hypothetical protein
MENRNYRFVFDSHILEMTALQSLWDLALTRTRCGRIRREVVTGTPAERLSGQLQLRSVATDS